MAGYQTAYAVSAHSDLFLIGMILGAPASAAYGLARRIFSLPVILGETINHAQWPALARADAAGDREGVGRVLRWTLLAGSSLALATAVSMAVAYEFLINLPLTLLLLPQIGPAGAIWGTVTGYTLALLLPYLVRLRPLLSPG